MKVSENFSNTQQITNNYLETRQMSIHICRFLETEDYVVQPEDFVSPIKWHLGHSTWFFETMILKAFDKKYKAFNEQFPFVFNSYYNSIGDRVVKNLRGTLSRPTVKEIMAYRKYVDAKIVDFLSQNLAENEEIFKLIELGLQHEQQHQELMVYDIKFILFSNPLLPSYFDKKPQMPSQKPANLEFLNVNEGLYEIGYQGAGFAWDNEKPVHKFYLQDFAIADRLVTNGEYLQFVEEKGYQSHQFWLADGWSWINENQISRPLYWFKLDGQWQEYTYYGIEKLDVNKPVGHVSLYEADAYARWAGKRLPLEQEWEIAVRISGQNASKGNFLESGWLEPVSATPKTACQFFGDLWEWTASAYQPYPGYKSYPGPLAEYNGKFMINQAVLRGGSCATPAKHIRSTYRNFFQPFHRWMFAGIRLAQD